MKPAVLEITRTKTVEIPLPVPPKKKKICFVDLTDIGTAPLAKCMANAMAKEKNRTDLAFFSRGLHAVNGKKMKESAKNLLKSHQIDGGEEHRAKAFLGKEDFDAVILLRRDYALDLMLICPEAEKMTAFFSVDVPDVCRETTFEILEKELKLFYDNY